MHRSKCGFYHLVISCEQRWGYDEIERAIQTSSPVQHFGFQSPIRDSRGRILSDASCGNRHYFLLETPV